MAGGFTSLNTALSALRYQQSALDIASSNVANASVDGYVRRRVVGQTASNAATSAVWSRSNEIGSGVAASSVQRLTDALLDSRVRREHAAQSYLDHKAEALARLETGISEPSDSGIANALNDFRDALSDLANYPTGDSTDAARSQVLASASVVADAVNLQARNFANEAADQRDRIQANVEEINNVAKELAATNQTITAASAVGSDTSTLLDTRDALALRLAELSGATATVNDRGGMDVTLNGQSLVSGSAAAALGVVDDGTTVTFALGTATGIALGGEAGASAELINQTIPGYLRDLGKIAGDLATAVNNAQAAGYDANGVQGTDLFAYDASNPTSMLTVKIDDIDKLAASSVAQAGASDGTNARAMIEALDTYNVDGAYRRLVNSFGTAVASVRQLAANQQVMTNQLDTAHEQLAGVSIDEETVNMVMAQRGYQAASRVMSTVDEMLDTLINRTGRVGL